MKVEIDQANNVRMVERCRCFCFLLEFLDIHAMHVQQFDSGLFVCYVHVLPQIDAGKAAGAQTMQESVAADLLAAGVRKDHIVLGFKAPHSRAFTGFAVA